MKRVGNFIALVLFLLAVALIIQRGKVGPLLPSKATSVVYVYEKDLHVVPNQVQSAINKLNRERKVTASIFDKDTVDGSGETPEQYKVALEAAKQAGLPCLVIQSGNVVLKVVKDPKTEQSVLEVVK